MKVMVFGANGFIGKYMCGLLTEQKHTVVEAGARLDNADAVRNELIQHQPSHVFSATGRTHGDGINTIDYLEQKGKLPENLRDNLFGPVQLALLCCELNVHCTIIGTGCIFQSEYDADGHPIYAWKETDMPNFTASSYSLVKGITDQLLHLKPLSEVLNLRIRMPIMDFPHPRCFISKIVQYPKVCSVENSMSYLPNLLPLVVEMMEQGTRGTVNLCNPGTVSHNAILKLYESMVDQTHKTVNFTLEEQAQLLAAGRSNNALDTTRLEQLFGNRVMPIHDAVVAALVGYQQHIS